MKFKFTLVTIASTTVTSPAVAGAIERLRQFFTERSLTVVDLAQSDLISGANGALPEDTFAFIAGKPDSDQISSMCRSLRERGNAAIIVVDAIEGFDGMKDTMSHLHEEQFQMLTTDGAKSAVHFMHKRPPYVYPFAKVDVTTTTAILLKDGTEAVVIIRGNTPFKGSMAFPGGFINPFLDASLAECAAREVSEEVGIKVSPEDLVVLSSNRESLDPRHHVENSGVVYWVPPDMEDRVRASIEAKDDAAGYLIVPVAELRKTVLAFDHNKVLEEALSTTPPWHKR